MQVFCVNRIFVDNRDTVFKLRIAVLIVGVVLTSRQITTII